MRRREFITVLGGAVAWPLTARAQQPERMRRIGVLMNFTSDDPVSQDRLAAFVQGLQELFRRHRDVLLFVPLRAMSLTARYSHPRPPRR
jgi:hypothetical protein